MTSKSESNWYQSYEALKACILERGHLPDKHVVENPALLSWAKYQRKKIKEGTLDADKRELFEEALLPTQSIEHTGGGRRRNRRAILKKMICKRIGGVVGLWFDTIACCKKQIE